MKLYLLTAFRSETKLQAESQRTGFGILVSGLFWTVRLIIWRSQVQALAGPH